MRVPYTIVTLVVNFAMANGHFSFVDIQSQIACDFDATDGINWLAKPILEGQTFPEWWMHGQVNCQSKAEGSFALPANGSTHIVMSSRVQKVPPPYSNGLSGFVPANPESVLTRQEWGTGPDSPGNTLRGEHNIHAYTRDDTSGCALAIAYKSNATDAKPEDFVVFTVVHDCPKRMRESIDVPNLPTCPNGNCICAWFWLPRSGSGLKNFYMTPFVCHVEGASPTASPVDVEYAIPPRRCLDPTLCNFGPRQPAYWLGADDPRINMLEDNNQSPNYSIIYGFREGAQHDIFINTNPRRHITKPVPVLPKCNGKRSRITEPDVWTDLTSTNCLCTAKMQTDGTLRIFDGNTPLSTVDIGGSSSPRDLINNASFKAGTRYFPKSEGPYDLILNDKCYLYVIDSKGVVVWESMYDNVSKRDEYVNNAYTGMSPDPSEWPVDGVTETAPPTTRPTITKSPSTKPTTYKPSMKLTSLKPTSAPSSNPTLRPTSTKPSAHPSSAPTSKHPPTKTPSKGPVVTTKPVCRGDGSSGCTKEPAPVLTRKPTKKPTARPVIKLF